MRFNGRLPAKKLSKEQEAEIERECNKASVWRENDDDQKWEDYCADQEEKKLSKAKPVDLNVYVGQKGGINMYQRFTIESDYDNNLGVLYADIEHEVLRHSKLLKKIKFNNVQNHKDDKFVLFYIKKGSNINGLKDGLMFMSVSFFD